MRNCSNHNSHIDQLYLDHVHSLIKKYGQNLTEVKWTGKNATGTACHGWMDVNFSFMVKGSPFGLYIIIMISFYFSGNWQSGNIHSHLFGENVFSSSSLGWMLAITLVEPAVLASANRTFGRPSKTTTIKQLLKNLCLPIIAAGRHVNCFSCSFFLASHFPDTIWYFSSVSVFFSYTLCRTSQSHLRQRPGDHSLI